MVVALHWLVWMWCGNADKLMDLREGWQSMCCDLFVGWIYVCLEGCVTGLPECGLGCGYDLAYGSVRRMAMGGGFTLIVP